MRIAFIAPFGLEPKGTVSARTVPLAHALAARGHRVRIAVPPWDDPAAAPSGKPSHRLTLPRQSAGVTGLVDVVTLPLPRRAPYSIALTAGLVKEALRPTGMGRSFIEFKPEVVHVFKPVGYSGLAGFALSAVRAPWVLDTDDWEGPGGWADVNPYSAAQKVAVTVQEALLPRMARAVTAASRTLEARAWDFGLPRERVFYLPNGVASIPQSDPEQDHRVKALKQRYDFEGRPVVLLYTRFAEFPWQWALELLENISRERPNAVMLVVGNGFFGEEKALKDQAAARGLETNLVVTGRVPQAEVGTYLSLGDVALYPMQDTLLNRAKSPVKVLEPMAAGLPIVAHRVGQAAEFLGDAGVLVQPGNLAAMARATVALLDDAARRAVLGNRARLRVQEEFNWDRLARTAECAYRTALAE